MIRLAREEDIEAILPWIPEMDVDPREAIRSRLGPYTYVGVGNGELGCMYGIRFFLIDAPQLWLLTTPVALCHQMRFLRGSRDFVSWARAEFGVIESLVRCNNAVSLRWLKWLGFRPVAQGTDFIRMSTHVE